MAGLALARDLHQGVPRRWQSRAVGDTTTKANLSCGDQASTIKKKSTEVLQILPLKLAKGAQFIWDKTLEDADKGWGERPVSAAALDKRSGRGEWAACPTFSIEQASGKRRRIADASKGRQNEHSHQDEKITLCAADQPAAAVKTLHEVAEDEGVDLAQEGFTIETGGEDMPDAYKCMPIAEEDLNANIEAVQNPKTGEWEFAVAWALLFGYANAVYSFDRVSKFAEAFGKRILALLLSMFYDDASLQDFAQAYGSGQTLLGVFFRVAGMGLKDEKGQKMHVEADYLGLTNNISKAMHTTEPIV